ncbi:hypothetical protein FLONG3_2733 [Fusarium longipes]|uniref:SP-RING-type domain-containing protein n=1 Tax=Fusarium longipes TaxID=694270 RepID=A0A395T4A4_9HYPO|nr:hypothetical protein FLONG3_2733 [Fusarium longipes]
MKQGDSVHVATNTSPLNYAAAAITQSASPLSRQSRVPEIATPSTAAQVRPGSNVPFNIQHNSTDSSGADSRVHTRSPVYGEHRAKRPRVQETSIQGETSNQRICQQWANTIERRVAQVTAQGLLNNNVEKPRYRILTEACQNEDFFYIAFHQALCAWSLNKEPVRNLFSGLVEPQLLDYAFEIMQTVARRFPLLAYELIHFLHCRARGLQSMLFTMSRRTLCVPDGPAAHAMNEIFERDRLDEIIHEVNGEPPEGLKSARDAVAMRHKQAILLSHQDGPSSTLSSPAVSQSPLMMEQNGRQSVLQSPLVTAVSPHAVNTTTPPLSLPNFDALAARASAGATNPMPVNLVRPQGSTDLQSPRRPSHLHIQTGTSAAPPPSAPVSQSPLVQNHPQPRSSSAGSPMMSQNWVLPSNGQARTPVLPSSDLLPPRRANSFAFLPPGPPNAHETNPHSPLTHSHSAGIQQVRGPAQVIHSHHTQAMQSPQHVPVCPPPNPPRRASGSQNHTYRAQATIPQVPYQAPVAINQSRQMLQAQQIPETEYPSSPYGYGSLQVGLHQVEVRSPRRVPSHAGKGRFYQFVRQLAHEPVYLEPLTGLRSLSFTVPEGHIRQLSKKIEDYGLPFCYYSEGSYRYRLRMCLQPEAQPAPTDSDWVVTPTSWPNHIFFNLNKKHLELRRKQHFNKDQPLELTDFLLEGENVLSFSYPLVDQNMTPGYKYFIAVELVETISHDAVRNVIQSLRHISSEETRTKIQRRLQPSDSDDIIIEDETLTISLADPFSATRFTEPVRGSQCKHLECFDLETWLQTRPLKPPQKGGGPREQGGEPSMVDVWKCPICSLDARPNNLWIDDYFAGVRRSLISSGDMRTKSITVAADGKWSPVLDGDDTDDDSTPAPQPRSTIGSNTGKQVRPPSTMAAPAIIEILDDD